MLRALAWIDRAVAAVLAPVVFAGMAGLTAALAFARLGWTVRVREQAPELLEVGAVVAEASRD